MNITMFQNFAHPNVHLPFPKSMSRDSSWKFEDVEGEWKEGNIKLKCSNHGDLDFASLFGTDR